jgi:hypothetical protein
MAHSLCFDLITQTIVNQRVIISDGNNYRKDIF